MKNLLTIFTILFLFQAYNSNAQYVNLGIRGGVAIPNIMAGSGNPLSEGYNRVWQQVPVFLQKWA